MALMCLTFLEDNLPMLTILRTKKAVLHSVLTSIIKMCAQSRVGRIQLLLAVHLPDFFSQGTLVKTQLVILKLMCFRAMLPIQMTDPVLSCFPIQIKQTLLHASKAMTLRATNIWRQVFHPFSTPTKSDSAI